LTDLMTTTPITATQSVPHEGTVMLIHEALARSRMREAEQAAREHALARSITAGRRWSRLARYAERRAALAADRASVQSRGVLRSV
jgi:hypothetical protein